MLKKILLTMIAFIIAVGFCACKKSEVLAETDTGAAKTTIATNSPEPEDSASSGPEQTEEPHIDKDFVLPFLDGGLLVFMEKAEDMGENGGSEFGEIDKKEMGSEGYEFTFVPNVNEQLNLLTPLDEFEGAEPLSGQAVFLRFQTTAKGIYFSFLGDNDFGVYFGDEGQPLVFTYTENNPFEFEGDLKLTENTWYNMLIAMDSSGVFNCIIYLDDGSEDVTAASVDLGAAASGAGYKDQSWQFQIATHEEAVITVEHYDVYKFDEFVQE